MTTTCFIPDYSTTDWANQPGAIAALDGYVTDEGELTPMGREMLSEFYVRDHLGKRKPMVVVLPCGHWWIIDQKATNAPGWVVTGEAPNLTAQGSIACVDYHGFLTDGVLTDDLESRTYPEVGK